MRKIKYGIICFLILALLSAGVGVEERTVSAAKNSYYITGYYETFQMIYLGNKVRIKGSCCRSSLKKGPIPTYEGNQIRLNKTIKLAKNCVVESGDEEMTTVSLKKYVKMHQLKKGDDITAVSVMLKVVKGKVRKIGFYA